MAAKLAARSSSSDVEAEAAARDSAMETASMLREDAEVVFKMPICVRETVYNILGVVALPVIIYFHGFSGARNRLFWGRNALVTTQLVWSVLFVLMNVLHALYLWQPTGPQRLGISTVLTGVYSMSTFEIVMADLLYALRALTIGIKYGYYSARELKKLDAVELDGAERTEKLVLVGWLAPTTRLLYRELERAVFRKVPNMCSHKIVFADRCTRDAMLWTMRDCIAGYLKYELDLDVEEEMRAEEAAAAAKQSQSTSVPEAPPPAAVAAASQLPSGRVFVVRTAEDVAKLGLPPELAAAAMAALQTSTTVPDVEQAVPNPLHTDGAQSVSASSESAARKPSDGEDDDQPEDLSLSARAVRRLLAWMDEGDAQYSVVDMGETVNRAIRKSIQARDDRTGSWNRTSDADDGAASVSGRTGPHRSSSRKPPQPPARPPAAPQGKTSASLPPPPGNIDLPYIPGKLLAWYMIYASHHGQFGKHIPWAGRILGLFFAFIPIFVRAGYNKPPFGTFWASWVVEICCILITIVHFQSTIAFVLVSPIDFSRRLKAMQLLDAAIDALSPVATDFAITQERGTGSARGSRGETTGVMQLMDYAMLPMSKIAVEHAQELEQADNDAAIVVRQQSASTQVITGRHRGSTIGVGQARPRTSTSAAGGTVDTDRRRSSFGLAALSSIAAPALAPAPNGRPTNVAANDISAVSTAATDGGRIEGWLTKRSFRGQAPADGGFFATLAANSWKRRYFVGESITGALSYHPSPGALAINTLRITTATRVYATRMHGRAHEFAIQFRDVATASEGDTDENAILYVCAPTESVKETWIAFISGTVERFKEAERQRAAADAARAAKAAIEAAKAAEQAAKLSAQRAVEEEARRRAQEQEEVETSILQSIERAHDSAVEINAARKALPSPEARARRASVLARHRMHALTPAGSTAGTGPTVCLPVLYGENLVAWFASRQLVMDFGESYRMRIQLYCACFAVGVIVAIILLFMNFTRAGGAEDTQLIMVAAVAMGQLSFSGALAVSIVIGSQLNDQATYHRFRLSRIETLICDFLVAGSTSQKGLSSGMSWRAIEDSPVQRQLRLTRQVAASIGAALVTETAVVPARVLFIPANMALLSTFWSLSVSGTLSAVRALGI